MDIFFKTIVSLQVSPSTLNTKKKTQYLMQAAPQAAVMGTVQGSRPSSMMSLMDATKSCFQQYVGFSGRASRSEYWFFNLSFIIAVIGMMVLTFVSGLIADALVSVMGMLTLVVYLAYFIPFFAVTIRRLHDVGKSGWMFLIAFIPLIGGILLLVWAVTDGEPHDNAYGPVPTNTL